MSAVSACAACDKDGGGLKACTACKLVKYCNVTCQKARRPQHKKECRKRAAEIFDDTLFRTPPPKGDCPICFLRLPLSYTQYQECCGKIICDGCVCADIHSRGNQKCICPFCRASASLLEDEKNEKMKERIVVGDVVAMFELGYRYQSGTGVPQDINKALELWHRAAKLGCAESHCSIGGVYFNGEGVEKDVKKAKYHWELGAIGGHVTARHNLGMFEMNAGNVKRAMKHLMISAGFGDDDSLEKIQKGFSDGHVTKTYFEKAVRAHKKCIDETQSDQRDAARHILGNIET
ncbi:hypothetical protein ACHAXR_011426 [Thalassiosira sp. AJA248-18]